MDQKQREKEEKGSFEPKEQLLLLSIAGWLLQEKWLTEKEYRKLCEKINDDEKMS